MINASINKTALIAMAGIASVLVMPSASAEESMQTYVVHTYGGADLIPAVRQQLQGTNSTVSSYQDKLVLMTTPSSYAQVQKLLQQIDNIPEVLHVSVRVGNQSTSKGVVNQSRIILGGQIGKSSDVRVSGQGRFGSYNRHREQNSTYQVKTLSGKPATISTGTLTSLTQNYVSTQYKSYDRPSRTIFIQGQKLVPSVQGIKVTPKVLNNGQVQVSLNQQNDMSLHNGHTLVNTQSLSNNMVVSRGTWVTVGSVNQSSSSLGNGWQGQMSDVVFPIQIKVD